MIVAAALLGFLDGVAATVRFLKREEPMKQPKPVPMKKTYDRTSPSGKKTAPDMTYGGKPIKGR